MNLEYLFSSFHTNVSFNYNYSYKSYSYASLYFLNVSIFSPLLFTYSIVVTLVFFILPR